MNSQARLARIERISRWLVGVGAACIAVGLALLNALQTEPVCTLPTDHGDFEVRAEWRSTGSRRTFVLAAPPPLRCRRLDGPSSLKVVTTSASGSWADRHELGDLGCCDGIDRAPVSIDCGGDELVVWSERGVVARFEVAPR